MTHTIGVIPGDGTGPEVVREGLKVLDAVRAVEGFDVELVDSTVPRPYGVVVNRPEGGVPVRAAVEVPASPADLVTS